MQQITFSATGGQPIPSTNVAGNSAIATICTEGITNLNFFATDFAEQFEPAHTLPIKIDKTPPSINGSRTPLRECKRMEQHERHRELCLC